MTEQKEIVSGDRPRSSTSSHTAPINENPAPSVVPSQDDEANQMEKPAEHEYPPQRVVNIVMFANFLAMFLVALDRTIIATAIPAITNHFNSLADVGWYASAYLITISGFQLIYGRIYTFYNTKYVYLASITMFELGSLICGVASNSTTLIVGRAIAGLGSCGIFSGGITLILQTIPLAKRPAYMGIFGAVFGIAAVAGPLLGGVFTDKVSWRWCFYINLPCGGVVIAIVMLLLKTPLPPQQHKLSMREKLNRLDPIGTMLFLPSIICLLLALQNGGTSWAWSSARVVVLLVLFGIGVTAFIGVQIWRQELATVPPRILTSSRSIVAGLIYSTFSGAGMMVMVYFIPIWFQAIKGVSAMKSGIMSIPMVVGIVISSMMAGFLTKKVGYYTPWMYFSVILTSIGAGLISTWTPTTNHSKWIGYQVLYGLGLGLGMQQSSVAAQTVLARKDVPTGASLMFFGQTLGGAVFVSVANNIFDNKLASAIASANVPGLSSDVVTKIGATDLRKEIPETYLHIVVAAYNAALRNAFYVGVAVSCATLIGASLMEWKSIKAAALAQEGPGASKPQTQISPTISEEKLKEVA